MPLGLGELPDLALCFSASGTPQLETFADPRDPSVVTVRIEGRSCRIEWDALAVTDTALASALAHIRSLRFSGTLTVSFRFGEWVMEESYTDHAAAFRRIRETTDFERDGDPAMESPYRLHRNPFEEVAPVVGSTAIEKACEEWSQSDGLLNTDFFAALDDLGVLERVIVVDYDDAQQGLVFRFVGWGHAKTFGDTWPVRAIGTRHDRDQPDNAYTRWIARQYDTAYQGQPRHDYIDSIIHTDNDSLPGRVQYERLLLPSRYVNGKPALMAISRVRPGLLPLRAGPDTASEDD